MYLLVVNIASGKVPSLLSNLYSFGNNSYWANLANVRSDRLNSSTVSMPDRSLPFMWSIKRCKYVTVCVMRLNWDYLKNGYNDVSWTSSVTKVCVTPDFNSGKSSCSSCNGKGIALHIKLDWRKKDGPSHFHHKLEDDSYSKRTPRETKSAGFFLPLIWP